MVNYNQMTFEELPEEKKLLLGPLFDPQNKTSLWNYMPGKYSGKLLAMVASAEDEILDNIMDEEALLKSLKSIKSYVPTINDQRLRYLFWLEYQNAALEEREMVMNNVHSLVCGEKSFTSLFLKLPYRACFLVCRPAAYQHVMKEMLTHGMYRLRQILDLPEIDANGKINTKILELKIKVTAMIDMRLHGAPTQKIHQVTQNLPGPPNQKTEVKDLIQKGDMVTIQQRLKEIEAEKRKLEGRSPVALEAEFVLTKKDK